MRTRPLGVTRRFSLFGRRFSKSTRGTAAIEFVLVAVPFLSMVLALLETALVFYAQFSLDAGVYEAARLIRTGQAQEQGFSAETFRTEVCERSLSIVDCQDALYIDVRSFENFNDINLPDPLNENGEVEGDFTYDGGQEGDIVIVRAFFEMFIFTPTAWGIGLGNMSSGDRLLTSTAAFRNEPFGAILE